MAATVRFRFSSASQRKTGRHTIRVESIPVRVIRYFVTLITERDDRPSVVANETASSN